MPTRKSKSDWDDVGDAVIFSSPFEPKASAGKSGKWRKVEVKMAAEEMTARTIAGYYP